MDLSKKICNCNKIEHDIKGCTNGIELNVSNTEGPSEAMPADLVEDTDTVKVEPVKTLGGSQLVEGPLEKKVEVEGQSREFSMNDQGELAALEKGKRTRRAHKRKKLPDKFSADLPSQELAMISVSDSKRAKIAEPVPEALDGGQLVEGTRLAVEEQYSKGFIAKNESESATPEKTTSRALKRKKFPENCDTELPSQESKATEAVMTSESASKRARISDAAIETAMAAKRPNMNETSREALASDLRMAIITNDYPATYIKNENMEPIACTLWQMIMNQPDPLPRICLGNLSSGALHVFCEGSDSVEWLRSLSGQTIGDVKIKVINAKDLPKPVKMAWKSKNVWVKEISTVLNIMQRINPELHTNEWKVIDTEVGEGHIRRIVLMDKISADFIKSKGYWLYAGVDRAFFKLLDGEGKQESRAHQS